MIYILYKYLVMNKFVHFIAQKKIAQNFGLISAAGSVATTVLLYLGLACSLIPFENKQ